MAVLKIGTGKVGVDVVGVETPLSTSLVSYWKMDAASGGETDELGTNDLDFFGTVNSATGKINNARDFPNTGFTGLENAATSGMNVQNFSVQFWVQFGDTDAYQTPIIYTSSSAWTDGFQFYLEGGFLKFAVNAYNASPAVSASISTATWYHVVGTYDGSTLKIYVNNTLTSSARSTTVNYTGTELYFGSGYGSSALNALVDESGYWSRVLTATDVSRLYNGGAGLAYPFGEGGGGGARRRIFLIS